VSRVGAIASLLPGRRWLAGVGNAMVDLIFPPCCAACQRPGAWFCADCLGAIEAIRPPVCSCCGWPLDIDASSAVEPPVLGSESGFVCHRCAAEPPLLDGIRAYGFYTGPLRQAIRQFKYQDLRSLASPLAKLMGEAWGDLTASAAAVTVIVPVPLHRSRERQRGYNQAALLARELGVYLQCPVAEGALIRKRATAPQVDLDGDQRRVNVKGAFAYAGNQLAGAHVLLVDDVFTTGATLAAAAAAVQEAGASSIWAYTLARARLGAGSK